MAKTSSDETSIAILVASVTMTKRRNHYRERQVLRAIDLADEQVYTIAHRRRHNLAQHSWGIVCGLDMFLGKHKSENKINISAGFAVDGYGRELVVAESLQLGNHVLDDLLDETGIVDVWLVYRAVAVGPRSDSSSGRLFRRIQEEAWIKLTCGEAGVNVDPWKPPGVPQEDLGFAAYREPPEDHKREWPVYLGRIVNTENSYKQTDCLRPQIAARVDAVKSPRGVAWIGMHGRPGHKPNRIVLSLLDSQGKTVERLAASSDGATTIRGKLDMDLNNVRLAGTVSGQVDAGIRFSNVVPPPQTARPWSIYGVACKDPDRVRSRLRMEILHPGDEGFDKNYCWAIGCLQADGGLKDLLSVHAGGVVEMGDGVELCLDPGAKISEGKIPADLQDPRFVNAVKAYFRDGIGNGQEEIISKNMVRILVRPETIGSDGSKIKCIVTILNDCLLSGIEVESLNLTITGENIDIEKTLDDGVDRYIGLRSYRNFFEDLVIENEEFEKDVSVTIDARAKIRGHSYDPFEKTRRVVYKISPQLEQ